MAPFKILIADDSKSLRQALTNVVARLSADWQVCGEAADGEEALEKVNELQPDVVLLDLSISRVNGVQVVENLHRNHPSTVVVLMSEQSVDAMQLLSQSLGVRGIPKSRMAAELIPMLKALAEELSARNKLA
jgi:DNA-binding NarL/FixJ family response regulator